MTFQLADLQEEDNELPSRYRPHTPNCVCGRFAKFLRIDHHYNGAWMLETMYLNCSRCGEVQIELV